MERFGWRPQKASGSTVIFEQRPFRRSLSALPGSGEGRTCKAEKIARPKCAVERKHLAHPREEGGSLQLEHSEPWICGWRGVSEWELSPHMFSNCLQMCPRAQQ